MSKYSIKQISQLSGIKPHTIRIWEKRYSIPTPNRTETNIRTYDDKQLKLVLNISTLLKHKFKISKISKLTYEEINEELKKVAINENSNDKYIHSLIISMVDLNEKLFNDTLKTYTQEHDFIRTVKELIYPFLDKIGILWLSNSIHPAQEHFVSNLIRQKIISSIDALPNHKLGADKYVLFLKENEWHEIGLLIGYYLIKQAGHHVFYLGQNTPQNNIEKVVELVKPKGILTICTHPLTDKKALRFSKLLSKINASILLSSRCANLDKYLKTVKNVQKLKGLGDFENYFGYK